MATVNSDVASKANGPAFEFKNRPQLSDPHPEGLVHSAGERVGTMASDISNGAADTIKSSRAYVKENPFKGLAYAAATGAVIGSVLTMILRSRK